MDASQPDLPPRDRLAIDPLRVRRLFERPRDVDDFIVREVSRRLAERMSAVRVEATAVLDLGCGDGADLAMLRTRFAPAVVAGVDLALRRARVAASPPQEEGLARWLRRSRGAPVAEADFAALPFAAKSFDVLWSNLALHWSSQPHVALVEWSRVAKVGAVVAFSAFGPDTFREVAAAFAEVDRDAHLMPFTDMHDYGDMLVAAGFATPVVDMERLTLTYVDRDALWRDIRSLGGHAGTARARGLHGRGYRVAVEAALDRCRDAEGRYRLTLELVFAHAFKGEPRTTGSGESIVRLQGTRPGSVARPPRKPL